MGVDILTAESGSNHSLVSQNEALIIKEFA
jgi:hypothetical protein